MPNWNYNSVTIHAPVEAVLERLVPTNEGTFAFNMHKLYPDRFPDCDASGGAHWDYDWATSNTGSKWFPQEIELS